MTGSWWLKNKIIIRLSLSHLSEWILFLLFAFEKCNPGPCSLSLHNVPWGKCWIWTLDDLPHPNKSPNFFTDLPWCHIMYTCVFIHSTPLQNQIKNCVHIVISLAQAWSNPYISLWMVGQFFDLPGLGLQTNIEFWLGSPLLLALQGKDTLQNQSCQLLEFHWYLKNS